MSETFSPLTVQPQLVRMVLFPIKSFPGVAVDAASILPIGGLANDRRWKFIDAEGNLINGKRDPALHSIRAQFDLAAGLVELRLADGPASQFHLEQQAAEVESWVAQAIGRSVHLLESRETGFPDDPDNAGPTLVTTASLSAVQSWFPDLSLDEIRRRFRFNLEFDAPQLPAFWEDCLVAGEAPVPFSIGNSHWLGTNACQRCAVPARDSLTGEVWPGFAREFGNHRLTTLPDWAPRAGFDHGYRLTLNTRYAGGGQTIRLGDTLQAGTATA